MFDRFVHQETLLTNAYAIPFRPVSIVSPTGDPLLHVPQVYVYISDLVSMFPPLSLHVV